MSLESVCARDLMQHEVVRILKDASVESAIEALEENGISGAPVVDTAGRLVGVFSSRDVARSEHMREGRLSTGATDESLLDWDEEEETEVAMERREGFSSLNSGTERVADWMSTEVLTVAPAESLRGVCSAMAREGAHRVFVVEGQKLVGVISSLDVVRHVAGEKRPKKSGKPAPAAVGTPVGKAVGKGSNDKAAAPKAKASKEAKPAGAPAAKAAKGPKSAAK
jgi:CBS domain-containing protein